MRKLQPILILCFIFFSTVVTAQQYSNGYSDSVKEFIRDWTAENKLSNEMVLDNSKFLANKLDSSILEFFLEAHSEHKPWKVWKDAWDTLKHIRVHIDSISISKKEVSLIMAKMKNPELLKWTMDYIPSAHFVDQFKIDSLNKQCNDMLEVIRQKIREYEAKGNYNLDSINTNPNIHRCQEVLSQNDFFVNGYWKFSTPTFIRNGKVGIFYYSRISGCRKFYVRYDLGVYRNINGHWDYFGAVEGGNWN